MNFRVWIVASLFAISLLSLTPLTSVRAEGLDQIFKKVQDLVAKENYPKAIEELSWAEKEIQKLNTQKLAKLIPSEVSGFTGNEPKIESAMGFTNVERTYTSGSKTIKLSLTGGLNNAMGGLAGLAKMGMMMGGAGGDQFRVDGRTASMSGEATSPEITIFLDSGSMLQLTGQKNVDSETLKSFAQGLKVAQLDEYLRGNQPS